MFWVKLAGVGFAPTIKPSIWRGDAFGGFLLLKDSKASDFAKSKDVIHGSIPHHEKMGNR